MEYKTNDISLGDSSLFKLAIGKRKTKKELLSLPQGDIPIISARLDIPFGFVSGQSYVCIDSKAVLWNIDSSRWDTKVLERQYKFIPTDHCGYMEILRTDLIPDYIAYKLYEYGLRIGFKHEYRASLANIKEVSIPVPVDRKGNFDVSKQTELAKRYQLCVKARNELLNTVDELSGRRITIATKSEMAHISYYVCTSKRKQGGRDRP